MSRKLVVLLDLPEVPIENADNGLYVIFYNIPKLGSAIVEVKNHEYLIPGLPQPVIAPGLKVFGPIPQFVQPTEPANETPTPIKPPMSPEEITKKRRQILALAGLVKLRPDEVE